MIEKLCFSLANRPPKVRQATVSIREVNGTGNHFLHLDPKDCKAMR